MVIFHIFNYFKSLIYAIIHNYKIFLTDIFLIAVSFLIGVMLVRLFYKSVSFLGGSKQIYKFKLVKKSEFDNPVLTVINIVKRIYIPMLVNTIAGAAIFFVSMSGILTINSILNILFICINNIKQRFSNLFWYSGSQIVSGLMSNITDNFIGILIEVILLILFISYIISIYHIENDAEYYFGRDFKISVGILWFTSAILAIILFGDLLCVIISNASFIDVMF